ncbi:metallophosphoesterase [Parvularcula bermudensis]|nr:metallophosphoesterase [Parvularcula bermudensis]
MGFFKKRHRSARPPISGAPGKRLYAIGDVHGCAEEFDTLLAMILEDHEARPEKPVFVVSLGDLIDRGPDSRRVIETFMRFSLPLGKKLLIAGNHEEMLLRGLKDDPTVLPDWLRHGGYAFCESYGLDGFDLIGLEPPKIAQLISDAMPPDHIGFLSSGVERVRFGDYLLVHAGINPERSLEEQTGRDLRWIREPFLSSTDYFGAVVVHGHTITDEVVDKPNRIGLDTGAYRTGRLTAVRLEEDEREFLSTN